ncbi:MAG: hypothetical protein ACFFB3_12595 [Candidatus Hodarchaeota archaeon]
MAISLIDAFWSFLPLILITGATIIVYIRGRKVNSRMMETTTEEIKVTMAPYGVDQLLEEKRTSSGLVLDGKVKKADSSLRSFRAVLSLDDRQLLISYLFMKLTRPNDYVLFETTFKSRPKVSLQVIPRQEESLIRKYAEYLTKLDDVSLAEAVKKREVSSKILKFDETFLVKSTNRRLALAIVGNAQFVRTMLKMEKAAYWMAVDRSENVFKAMFKLNDSLDMTAFAELFIDMTERISSLKDTRRH